MLSEDLYDTQRLRVRGTLERMRSTQFDRVFNDATGGSSAAPLACLCLERESCNRSFRLL